jgi:hypothetical protein
MNDFRIRTEDLKDEEILGMYVKTKRDRRVVESLKSPTPVILQGSRGTGKSFLLKVARAELQQSFAEDRILAVYLSFVKSSLIHTSDEQQFLHWMLAKLCSAIVRELHQRGLLVHNPPGLSIISGGSINLSGAEPRIQAITRSYEDSYLDPGTKIDSTGIPSVDDFKLAIEDLCESLKLNRISIFFDEAAHIFRPAQQRKFFTLFRDLRSPYISCNAAVYPGVTSYGPTFEPAHDATMIEIHRSVMDDDYRESMREIVAKQADAKLMTNIERQSENFFALAYAVSGNPRLLLKTVSRTPSMKSSEVTALIKGFYRTDIWAEHTGLADRYSGHRALVDWGRDFIENSVIPESLSKNQQWDSQGKLESTCFFWIHRDAPEAVKEALRLLAYTGVVVQGDSGIVATRGEIGTRYMVNLGCLVSPESTPIPMLTRVARHLNIKRFTEYGANHQLFSILASQVGTFSEPDMSAILQTQLERSVSVLDVTSFQRESLAKLGLDTIGKALTATEQQYQEADYIGPKRSRRIKNAVVASVLEYLSG